MNSGLHLLTHVKVSSRKSEIQFWGSAERSRLEQYYCIKVKKKSVFGMNSLTWKKYKKRKRTEQRFWKNIL